MSKLPISAQILTWNSEQTLERALRSVARCAEIIVIDGGSVDGTVAIAEAAGARVLPQRFPGTQGKPLADFSAARTVGLESGTQPWILCLDSDEQMEPDAMKELEQITKAEKTAGAFLVPRIYMREDGVRIERASTYPNERLYFFRRDAAERWEKPVHERIALKPGTTVGRLAHGSLAPLAPIAVFRSKLAQYLRIEVETSHGKGWGAWLRRVFWTIRGRCVALARIARIWLMPGRGARLPMEYERARFWYAWNLIVMTCPLSQS